MKLHLLIQRELQLIQRELQLIQRELQLILNFFVFMLIITIIVFFIGATNTFAQVNSPIPSQTPQPTASSSVNPTSTPIPTPLPTSATTPQPTVFPTSTATPIPVNTPVPTSIPTSTPVPFIPSITDDNSSSGGINSPLFDEDFSNDVIIIPLPQVINQVRDQLLPNEEAGESRQQENIIQQQTPGELINPIIPREVLERIIPSGLYKDDGLHPIDGLLILIFGVGFIISGISLLRSDVFLPALSDIELFLKSPFRKKYVSYD